MTTKGHKDSESPIAPPGQYDGDWREKIAHARREREAARKARKGKPVSFPRPSIRPRGDRNDAPFRYRV